MAKLSTSIFLWAALYFLLLIPFYSYAQEPKDNGNSGTAGLLVISLISADDPSYPQLQNLDPDKMQLELYGKQLEAWIKVHESSFKNTISSCDHCLQLSTADLSEYGESSISVLKELIDRLGPVLSLQIKDHESLYPSARSGEPLQGNMKFL